MVNIYGIETSIPEKEVIYDIHERNVGENEMTKQEFVEGIVRQIQE